MAELKYDEWLNRILVADDRRRTKLDVFFDPISGQGSIGERKEIKTKEFHWWVPLEMFNNPFVKEIKRLRGVKNYCDKYGLDGQEQMVMEKLIWLRAKTDFPFFAAKFVLIKAKKGGKNIPFVLNYPQRILVYEFEKMRLAGVPIKVIVLKARQWGGSTATQIYMSWIQLLHKSGWYSAIVAHQSSAALKIKAMYDKMIREFPPSLLNLKSRAPLRLSPYSGSRTDYTISQEKRQVRDTVISIGSMQSPDSVRAGDVSMVHYSEVGLYRTTEGKTPEDLIQAISSSIPDEAYAMNVMESTAKGEHNLFHHEWIDSVKGISGRVPVFVPWYIIEMYRKPFDSEKQREMFARRLWNNRNNTQAKSTRSEPGAYLWSLWVKEDGPTLEALHWYVTKRREYRSHEAMASEFPSDDIEAFAHSGQAIFDRYNVDKLKDGCSIPKAVGEVVGDAMTGPTALHNVKFVEDTQGFLRIWDMPDKVIKTSHRYVVSVDVGGASDKSDFSDIVVIDRWWRSEGESDQIVAEWHGHCPHEQLAWKMLQIAHFYNDALLVPEANTFSNDYNRTEGDHAQFILDLIGGIYRNMYTRQASPEKIRQGKAREWGFFTSRSSKEMIIDHLKMLINTGAYIEREEAALEEYKVYQRDDKGAPNAAPGYHDDRVMARAIGLWVSSTMPIPREVRDIKDTRFTYTDTSMRNESQF